MVRFEIVSEKGCLIDGVGELEPGVPMDADPFLFKLAHGYPIGEASFPEFVKLTVFVSDDVLVVDEGGE